jgi:hypothetical protein
MKRGARHKLLMGIDMTADQKPIHAFAAILWIIAAVLIISQFSEMYMFGAQGQDAAGVLREALSLINIWKAVTGGLYAFATLGAAAVLIDLVDHLRWLATPQPERAALAHGYLISRWRRSRVS